MRLVEAVRRLVGAARAVVGVGPPRDGAADGSDEVAQGVGDPLAVLARAALRGRAGRRALAAALHGDRQGRWRRLRVGRAGDLGRPRSGPGVLGDGAYPDGSRLGVAEVVEGRRVRAGPDGLVAVTVDLVAGDRATVAGRGPPAEGDAVAVLVRDVEVGHALGRAVRRDGRPAGGLAEVGAVAGRHRDRLRSDRKRAGGLGARPGRTAEAAAGPAGGRVRDPLATARVRGSHRVADVGGLVVAGGDGARDGGLVGIAVGRVAPVVGLVGRRRTTVGRRHDVVHRLPLVGHRVARDPGVTARAGRDEVPRAASGAPEDVVLRDGRAVGVGRGPGDRHLGVGLAGDRRARAQGRRRHRGRLAERLRLDVRSEGTPTRLVVGLDPDVVGVVVDQAGDDLRQGRGRDVRLPGGAGVAADVDPLDAVLQHLAALVGRLGPAHGELAVARGDVADRRRLGLGVGTHRVARRALVRPAHGVAAADRERVVLTVRQAGDGARRRRAGLGAAAGSDRRDLVALDRETTVVGRRSEVDARAAPEDPVGHRDRCSCRVGLAPDTDADLAQRRGASRRVDDLHGDARVAARLVGGRDGELAAAG